MNRILGVLMLKASTYREIADDPNAMRPALLIASIVGLVLGIVSGITRYNPSVPEQLLPLNLSAVVVYAIVGVLFALLAWFVGGWVLALVARWFGGKTNTREMLRVTGYVELYSLIGLLSLLALLVPMLTLVTTLVMFVASVLRLLGYIVGIREAGEFSTGNAIITALFATVVVFLIRGAAEVTARLLTGVLGA